MKRFLLFLFSLIILQSAFSCGNEYGVTFDGERLYTRYFYITGYMREFNMNYNDERLEELQTKVNSQEDDFKTWSNIALNLMKKGKTDSAITILKPLMEKHPNEYTLAANLGTAYELKGKLDLALTYIKKGLEINPESHGGSEWVHVKILEAKIKQKRSPGYLDRNRIISVEDIEKKFNYDPPSEKNALRNYNRDFFRKVDRHLMYQIRTRLPFTPAPNKVISNLLLTYGDINKKSGTYENALLGYAYAAEFEPNTYSKSQIKRKIKALNNLRDEKLPNYEAPYGYLDFFKRAKLDPELVLLGLEDYAAKMDSIDTHDHQLHDSLTVMNERLQATQKELKELNQKISALENKPTTPTKSEGFPWLFTLGGVVVGIGLYFAFQKIKK